MSQSVGGWLQEEFTNIYNFGCPVNFSFIDIDKDTGILAIAHVIYKGSLLREDKARKDTVGHQYHGSKHSHDNTHNGPTICTAVNCNATYIQEL